jgi:Domain of unknown function (DUF4389)
MEASQPPTPPPSDFDHAAVAAAYPARADIPWQEEYNRWLPLVKWLLAIPHYIVLIVLVFGAFFALLIAAFAILFTRRYPRGLFDYMLGLYRWGWRVASYVLLMNDRYPPFTLADDPSYPARVEIEYPEEVDRWRPFVQWFLAIPYLALASVLQNLAHLLVLFAFFTILFTKKFPRGMFDLLLVAMRFNLRGNAYAHFMTTRYPPFVWA